MKKVRTSTKKKELVTKIVKVVIGVLLYIPMVVATIVSLFFTSDIYGWTELVTKGETTELVQHGFFYEPKGFEDNVFLNFMFHTAAPASIKTLQIVTAAIALALLLTLLVKLLDLFTKTPIVSKKGITIAKLALNFVKWTIAIAAVFLTLWAWGADTTMMLASAGVVTLIIGLGSQALVADILAGIFIVFEGDFQVGDIVVIDGWRGEIQSIGIRTTKLIDAGGNVKIVNNSEIKTIINQTKELSIAKCYVAIGYEARIENVEAVIADNIDKIKDKIPAIVEGPFYKGVSELAESSVNLLFVAKCNENDIYQVERDLNREIKIMFDDNNIGIPFNQLVVHMGEDDKPKETVTKKTVKKVNEFAEEQKELSKDIEIKK